MNRIKEHVGVLRTGRHTSRVEDEAMVVNSIGMVGANRKQLYNEQGLVAGLHRVSKMNGAAYKGASIRALGAIINIGTGGKEVQKGLYEHEDSSYCFSLSF